MEWLFSQRLGGLKKIRRKIGIHSGDKKEGHAINDEINEIAAQAIEAAEFKAL